MSRLQTAVESILSITNNKPLKEKGWVNLFITLSGQKTLPARLDLKGLSTGADLTPNAYSAFRNGLGEAGKMALTLVLQRFNIQPPATAAAAASSTQPIYPTLGSPVQTPYYPPTAPAPDYVVQPQNLQQPVGSAADVLLTEARAVLQSSAERSEFRDTQAGRAFANVGAATRVAEARTAAHQMEALRSDALSLVATEVKTRYEHATEKEAESAAINDAAQRRLATSLAPLNLTQQGPTASSSRTTSSSPRRH